MWIKGLQSQGVPKDVAKLLTHEAFEVIFNIFERYTGLSKEPIPQVNIYDNRRYWFLLILVFP